MLIREGTISRSIWKISEQREPKSQWTQSGLWKREMGEKSGNSKRLERAEEDGRRERERERARLWREGGL